LRSWIVTYLPLAWPWLTACCSLDRLTREVGKLPYRHAPLYFHPRKGLYIQPARSAAEWRRNVQRARAAGVPS